MSRTISFTDATEQGIVQKGHYFMSVIPKDRKIILTEKETGFKETQTLQIVAGEEKLWQLGEGLKMLGKPTQKGLTLKGKIGFEQGIDSIHQVASQLYELEGVFEKVQSCSLSKKQYEGYYIQILKSIQKEITRYSHTDYKGLSYWLASGCISSKYDEYLDMFLMSCGYVGTIRLYSSSGGSNSWQSAIRPEATPKPMLLLETDGLDGSREKPWRCIGK